MQIQDNYTNPYGNYASTIPGPRYATNIFDTDLEGQLVMFACYGGRTSRRTPDLLYSIAVVCDITDLAEIKGAPIDEKESRAAGKMKYKSNKGQMHTTTIKINGAAIYGLSAIVGYDFSNDVDANYKMAAPSTLNVLGDTGILGCLFVHSGSYSRHLRNSEVLTQCRLKVASTPGTTDSFSVEVESEGEHMVGGNGHMYVYENFVDKGNGLIINAFAPDGSQTVFKVGNGNQSLLGATLPNGKGLPLSPVRPKLMPAGTIPTTVIKPEYWFVEVAVDGQPLQPSDMASYDHATGELTLVNPPAMGSCLSLIYSLPTGKPDFNEMTHYYLGDVRMYNGDYYECTTANGPGAWNILNWTLIPAATHRVGAIYRPHNYGQNIGTEMNRTVPTSMFWSWTLMNYTM